PGVGLPLQLLPGDPWEAEEVAPGAGNGTGDPPGRLDGGLAAGEGFLPPHWGYLAAKSGGLPGAPGRDRPVRPAAARCDGCPAPGLKLLRAARMGDGLPGCPATPGATPAGRGWHQRSGGVPRAEVHALRRLPVLHFFFCTDECESAHPGGPGAL